MTVTRHQRNEEMSEVQTPSIGHSQKKKALETCQQIYGKDLTEDEAREWREILGPIPGWIVNQAFKQWVRTEKFFPKPVQILELVNQHKGKNQVEFRPCEKNGCMDGWIRVFEGRTVGSSVSGPKPVDPKLGALVRCQCFYEWSGGKVVA